MWYIPQGTSTALSLLVEGKQSFLTTAISFFLTYLFSISLIWVALKQKFLKGLKRKTNGNHAIVFISLRGVKGSTSKSQSLKWDTDSLSQDFLYKWQYTTTEPWGHHIFIPRFNILNQTLCARWSVGLAACKNIIFPRQTLPPFICVLWWRLHASES